MVRIQRTLRGPRPTALVALVLAALVIPMAPLPAGATGEEPCPDHQYVEHIGWVCPSEDGLLEVLHSDGSSAFVHGIDPSPGLGTLSHTFVAPEDDPVCTTGGPTEYFGHVIYARAHDLPDGYAANNGAIQTYVKRANGLLNMEADEHGHTSEYRVLCSGGAIVVENEVLPTNASATDFNTIVSDLRTAGYDSHQQKYWVWYDDASSGCFGIGHVYSDDSASVDNWNNGRLGAISMYGVTWGGCTGDNGVLVMMHENGHNMGAVQSSAPDSSGDGLHCNDGLDIMCYSDGGSNSSYDAGVCSVRYHFDCDHDTYFNPDPGSTSYLSNFWNIGHDRNRFVDVAFVNTAPVMSSLSCTPDPSDTGQLVSCTFEASDTTSDDIFYTVDWGDGSGTTRVPSSGFVAPGTSQNADHAYSSTGTFTISVTATDDESPALTSSAMTEDQTVVAASNDPPIMLTLTCSPEPSDEDETATCSFSASDDSTGVFYTVDWGDGSPTTRVPSSGFVAPGSTRSAAHSWTNAGNYVVSVTATDDGATPETSAPKTWNQEVVVPPNAPPVMASLSCTPDPAEPDEVVSCVFRATDADSDGVSYTLNWGDGSPTVRVPAVGFATPGVNQVKSHPYASAGAFTVTVTPTDDESPAATGAPATQLVDIIEAVCQLDRRGQLLVGLGGTDVQGVSAHWQNNIPTACWGETYRLVQDSGGHDFNVCWYTGGGTQIRCDENLGVDQGTIPDNASKARIIYNLGARSGYRLFV